ncbi:MAG: imidazole glycerol phosphate synthase subunit HisH [Oscillospiraceae bacterium]|nr:imidazole glycerol phosphate synthase subunit HisH [Oscillospiraceae bacterium]
MIAIIDYGVGNLFSLRSSLNYLGFEAEVSGDVGTLSRAEKLILPGVGAFGDAMDKLKATGLVEPLLELASNGRPLLGICLGMQMLFDESFEFGKHAGLGLLKGRVEPMETPLREMGSTLKVPQIGWNALHILRPDCPLLRSCVEGSYVYYVHSYYAVGCSESLAAESDYGVSVPGVVWKDNVFGTQFHPEKSGEVGLGILKAFCEVRL